MSKTITEELIDFLRKKGYTIEEPDPFDGVEYVKCLKGGNYIKEGEIYKLEGNFKLVLSVKGVSYHKNNFKPSNKEAYLIQEAKKKFGEIKVGDKFYHKTVQGIREIKDLYTAPYTYSVERDLLKFAGVTVYYMGIWADKYKSEITLNTYVNGNKFIAEIKNFQGSYEELKNKLKKALEE